MDTCWKSNFVYLLLIDRVIDDYLKIINTSFIFIKDVSINMGSLVKRDAYMKEKKCSIAQSQHIPVLDDSDDSLNPGAR